MQTTVQVDGPSKGFHKSKMPVTRLDLTGYIKGHNTYYSFIPSNSFKIHFLNHFSSIIYLLYHYPLHSHLPYHSKIQIPKILQTLSSQIHLFLSSSLARDQSSGSRLLFKVHATT